MVCDGGYKVACFEIFREAGWFWGGDCKAKLDGRARGEVAYVGVCEEGYMATSSL